MSESQIKEDQEKWTRDWLQGVIDGSNPMSQRKLTSIEKHAGNLEAIKSMAQEMGVHLLLVEDDAGNELVAASLKPFTVIC